MKLFNLIFTLALSLLLLAAGGCRIIDYTGADGRKLKIVSVGNDTAIGKLDVATPEGGTLGLENLDSKARLADTINELAKRLPVAP